MARLQRILALALVLLSVFLLFWRLDGAPIWRDEATTSVWARQMAEQGAWLPWVYDFEAGQLMVQAPDGHDVNRRFLPAMQGYLQFYVSALSFRLLGVSEWSARLPYALLGALTLWLLYRLGAVLFGRGLLAFVPPAFAVTSILFLHAARQGRYYILVALAAAWLLLEFAHYFRDPKRAERWTFWAKLAGAGFLLYFSNYVSFIGTWAAIGLFVLWRTDRRFIRRFVLLSAAMALPIGADFFALHAQFVETWPPAPAQPWLEVYQRSLVMRGRDFWRMAPLAILVPAGLFLYWRSGRNTFRMRALFLAAALVAFLPIVVDGASLLAAPFPVYALFALWCAAAPVAFYRWWRERRPADPSTQAALLAAMILIVGPLLTIAAGRGQAITRHYYQILPAIVVLSSCTVAAFARRISARSAIAVFGAAALWPSLDLGFGGTEHIVPRQFLKDRSYVGPALDYFAENVKAGDEAAFVRNVKGMTLYHYFPEIRWVGLLNADAPHNQQFLGLIPHDQFDAGARPDWYVLWDTKDEVAKNLDDSYEKTWVYSYDVFRSWWDRNQPPYIRTYEIYRRRD